jgi:hypothetical protein
MQNAPPSGYHPLWNSVPTLAWVVLILIALLIFKDDLRSLLQLLSRRLRLGAGLKLGAIEIGQAYVEPGQGTVSGGLIRAVRKDTDERRHAQREQYYQPNRLLMLVHRVVASSKPGQLYDILIYLIPHPTSDATLVGVTKVEYYFGKSWGQSIFTSVDRARGFAIATSAYGPFVCTAEIHFSDGEVATVARYIDFEMGGLGPQPEPPGRRATTG